MSSTNWTHEQDEVTINLPVREDVEGEKSREHSLIFNTDTKESIGTPWLGVNIDELMEMQEAGRQILETDEAEEDDSDNENPFLDISQLRARAQSFYDKPRRLERNFSMRNISRNSGLTPEGKESKEGDKLGSSHGDKGLGFGASHKNSFWQDQANRLRMDNRRYKEQMS